MNTIKQLVADMKDDAACWECVQREFGKLREASAERRRLQRMLNEAMERESEVLTAAQLALTVIKNRQDGAAG